MSVEMLNKRTRERVAACQAIGMEFWADHPAAGHVWAVDSERHFHAVRIFRSQHLAQHACALLEDGSCCASGDYAAVAYQVSA